MSQIQNISFDDISRYIQESLFYKSDDFKESYTDVIKEKLELQNKKR